MKRVTIYINRKGQLMRLCLWEDLRHLTPVTGLRVTKLNTQELDARYNSSDAFWIAPDLMSGELIEFSNRRPISEL